jgi:hypothetical protein
MADYGQPAAVTKRVRFFDGQYLQDQDFVDEQKYQLDRTRRLSRLLGFTGIGEGLVVSEVAGKAYTLKVTAGSAVDPLGRQLVLPTDATLVLPADKFARQQNVAVLIAFREAETDVAQTGGRSARRWDETPVLAAVTTGGAVAVSPADASTTLDKVTVPLATVSINDTGVIVVSRVAGRATGLTVGSLTATGNVGIGTAEPRARLEIAGGGGGSSVDLIVSGRLRSDSNEGGMWVGADRFVGGFDANIGLYNAAAGYGLVMTRTGDIGIGTTTPENAEGWNRTLDLFGKTSAKLSVRMDGIDARLMAHPGLWGAQPGMVLGTKTNHAVSIGTNAATRLTVDAAGSVGIGTPRPTAKLEVTGGGGMSIDVVVNGRLKSNSDDGGLWVKDDRFVGGFAEGKVGFFNTTASWGLVMTKTGDVGIGTMSPENAESWNRTLDLYGKASAKLSVRMDGIETRVMAHTGFWGAPAGMVLGTKTNHAVSIGTNATNRLTVADNGDVGIGTPTPGAKLDVAGRGGTAVDLVVAGRMRSNSDDGGLWVKDDRFVGGFAEGKVGFFNTTASWGLVMTRTGDVGIGTTAPENAESWARTLDIYGKASAKLSVRMEGIETRLMAHTGWWGAPAGLVLGTKTNHAVSIGTAAATRLTVSEKGDVGIGTTAPENAEGWSRALDVVGGWNAKFSLRTTSNTVPIDGRVMVHSDGIYGAGAGMIVGTRSNHPLSFVTNGANRMFIDKVGQIFCNGTLFFPLASFSGWGGEPRYGNVSTQFYWTLGRDGWNTNDGSAANPLVRPSGGVMPSDVRLKDAMVELTDAAARIERLRGVTFNWNEEGLRYLTNFVDDQISAGPEASQEANQAAREEVRAAMYPALSRSTIGVIAQEVQAVLPELVYTGRDGIMKVDYGKLSAVLVQAVKEQQASIRALTERIDGLGVLADTRPADTRPTDPEEN